MIPRSGEDIPIEDSINRFIENLTSEILFDSSDIPFEKFKSELRTGKYFGIISSNIDLLLVIIDDVIHFMDTHYFDEDIYAISSDRVYPISDINLTRRERKFYLLDINTARLISNSFTKDRGDLPPTNLSLHNIGMI